MNARISKQLLIALLFLCSFLGNEILSLQAQTADELKEKISAKSTELQKLGQEITQYKNDLNNLGTQKNTLKSTIKVLDLTKKKLETDIKITQTKVDTTDLKIRQLTSDISYKENEIVMRISALKEAILYLHEKDSASLAEITLSNDNFSGLWSDLDKIQEFSIRVYENVIAIKSLKKDLEDKNKKKNIEKKQLLGLKSELSDQKIITENAKKQKGQLLTETSNQETRYQKTLQQKLILKDTLEKELRDYESTLKFILDPSSIPPRGSKVFSAPLDNMLITQNFGKTSASGRLYASGTHNGTDFRALIGTPVRAMQNGVIGGVGDTDVACPRASFGKWVLIRYSNGLASVYGHLSLTKVYEGQVVNTGEVVGYSGNTGYSTGPHLHVSVYASTGVKVESRPSKSCGGRIYTLPLAAFNAYLDPMDYL